MPACYLSSVGSVQDAPCERSHCRNLGIAERPKSVHPGYGMPINHSTQSALSFPLVALTTIPRLTCLPFAILRWTTLVPMCPRSRQSDACGVGHMLRRAIVFRDGRGFPPMAVFVPYSFAVGVGSIYPHPVSSMGCRWVTRVPSSQHAPPNVIPQAGKSFDNGAETTGTKERTVFREDKRRPHLFNNAEHLEP